MAPGGGAILVLGHTDGEKEIILAPGKFKTTAK